MREITDEGTRGKLYEAGGKSKVMIVVTGSDGGGGWADEIAKTFARAGVASLALSYWKDKGLPKTLSLIPIERIASAAGRLKSLGYEKVGIYGVSKGAELALTAASLLPQIAFVAAVSPACCVFEGIAKPKYSGASSWTWNGNPLDYADFSRVKVNMVKNVIRNRQLGFTAQYLEVLAREKNEGNTIKVENIKGPVLLLSAANDAQWPSQKMGEMIVERLREKGFPFPFRHEIFDPASHILCPVHTKLRFAYRAEREHPAACDEARKQALAVTLSWLEQV